MSISVIFNQDTETTNGTLCTRLYRVQLPAMYQPGEVPVVWLLQQIAAQGKQREISLLQHIYEDWQAIRDAVIQHDAALERLQEGEEL